MPDALMNSNFPALDGNLGAIEIGVVLGTFPFGIETLQAFNYCHHFLEDLVLLKTMVSGTRPYPTNSMVQIFFGNRIQVLSGHLHVVFLCFFLTLLRFICEAGLMVAFWVSGAGFSVLHSNFRWEMTPASSMGPAIDLIIVICGALDLILNRCDGSWIH
ncbi:hypothetical protein B0H10DRAFT_1959646 [Mycena sp. CBHHK59/15]|nr:hypothetical protein B0H10DRAFT_1959646 [Mycena sp. CBHHK59/15]